MLALLKNRNYFWLWMGQTVSQVGDEIRNWAMIYWVFRASGESPIAMSASFIAAMLPTLVLGPIAGVWVDRWDRKKTMIISDIVRGVLSLFLIAAVATGQYWYALAVTFLASCAGQFFGPARGAMIRRVVPQEQLMQANSLAQTTTSVLQLAGPAMGTAIFIFLGSTPSFLLDSATFLLSALCIALVAASGAVAPTQGRPDFVGEMKVGLQFLWNSRPLRVILLSIAILMCGAGAINSLGMVMVRTVLGLPETSMAYTATLQPLASLIAAVALGTAARKVKKPPLLVAAGMALAAVGIGGIAGAVSLIWMIGGVVLVGVANVVLNIGMATTYQSLVPEHLMGRVGAALNTPPMAFMILSAGVAGPLATVMNPRYILAFGAVMIGLAGLSAFLGLRDVTLSAPAAAQPVAETGD